MTERTWLAKEFSYYLAHQDELVERYDGRVIVIKDGEGLGAYGSLIKAVTETNKGPVMSWEHSSSSLSARALTPIRISPTPVC